MRTRQFEVPNEIMFDFAQVIEQNNLSNWIEGTSENGEIILFVEFENKPIPIVQELDEMIDDFYEDEENEEDELDDDEEQDYDEE